MDQNIVLTIIEFLASLLIEGVILAFIFQMISNKSQEKQKKALQEEMNNIEKQSKFDFQQLQGEIRQSKTEIIAQIKESGST